MVDEILYILKRDCVWGGQILPSLLKMSLTRMDPQGALGEVWRLEDDESRHLMTMLSLGNEMYFEPPIPFNQDYVQDPFASLNLSLLPPSNQWLFQTPTFLLQF